MDSLLFFVDRFFISNTLTLPASSTASATFWFVLDGVESTASRYLGVFDLLMFLGPNLNLLY